MAMTSNAWGVGSNTMKKKQGIGLAVNTHIGFGGTILLCWNEETASYIKDTNSFAAYAVSKPKLYYAYHNYCTIFLYTEASSE